MLDNGAARGARIYPTLPSLAVVLSEEERKARLAYWIREMRTQRRLTPPRLALLIGVGRSTVNKWEAGAQVPSMIWLGPLSMALRVDPRLFADLPAIPPRGGAEYLVDEAVRSGLEEGRRRARVPVARVSPAPKPGPRPREAAGGRAGRQGQS
jgi:transcriptional regulator with XRE-family HTH domain